jgi:dTDP-4-dehydrorhamnose 3,5-epimerase-like enzyme
MKDIKSAEREDAFPRTCHWLDTRNKTGYKKISKWELWTYLVMSQKLLDPFPSNIYIMMNITHNEVMMDMVTIEKLPNTKDMDGVKRWVEEKGEFAQIAYKEEIKHLAFFELKKGFFRGSHVHKQKEEIFYVISGRIQAIFRNMETLQQEEHIMVKGDKIRVKTNCGHIFCGLEDALVIEYSPQEYDKGDAYPVDFGKI